MLWYEAETRRIDPSTPSYFCVECIGDVFMYVCTYGIIRTFEEKFDTSVGWLLLSFQLVMELLE